jgi:MFS family permease
MSASPTAVETATPPPSGGTPTPTPHRWRSLAVMTGVEVIDNTEAGVTTTLFPSIAKALSLDSSHLGLLAALGKVFAVPFGPFWVWAGDKYGRRNALVASSVLAGICGILAGFSHGFVQLLIWNTLLSAILNGAQPVTNAVIADAFDDKMRAKATGYYYGVLTAVSSFLGPVLALFTGSPDGWRIAMWVIGGLCLVVAVLMQLLFVDPKVGASEAELVGILDAEKAKYKVTWSGVMRLFRIPSFNIMMLSRLLSGHLLISVFGIQFLVTERGFSNAVAALVLVPFGIGYVIATFAGGFIVTWLDRVWTDTGRVVYIMTAQILFAGAAYLGTQFHWGGIGVYGIFWALMGACQGLNPPVNRPIVMAVVVPELRGQAFAIFLTFFQTIGWALFSFGAGAVAKNIGIESAFMIFLVVLMVINGLVLGGLLFTYRQDAQRVKDELARRRADILGRDAVAEGAPS